jgi:hypothetical protein
VFLLFKWPLSGIKKRGGVPDLRTCHYYFIGNVSTEAGFQKGLANFKNSSDICFHMFFYPTDIVHIYDDIQISTILSLYKAGNLCFKHCFVDVTLVYVLMFVCRAVFRYLEAKYRPLIFFV